MKRTGLKEMRDGETPAKLQRHILDQQPDRNGRCVRGDDRIVRDKPHRGAVQILLDVEAFNHGFGDPVAVGKLIEIVACITEVNKVPRLAC